MNKECAKKQADLILNVIREINKAYKELNEMCEKECQGKRTNEANEYYSKEYKQTYHALFNAVDVITLRYYELNKIVNK